jgi:hypothetical protein
METFQNQSKVFLIQNGIQSPCGGSDRLFHIFGTFEENCFEDFDLQIFSTLPDLDFLDLDVMTDLCSETTEIFSSWCAERQISPTSASVGNVADFFVYLHSVKKCKMATIIGYRSAISSKHKGKL